MKKFLIITVLIVSATFLSFRVFAQTDASTDPFQSDQAPVIQDVEGLRADFNQETQDPESKQVTFEMILKSGIDADRVKITWTLQGSSKFVNDTDATKDITIQSGKTYSIPITILPTGYGVTELRGQAEAFKADGSYLVLVRKNFASNASQEVLPLTAEYNQAKTLSIVKTVVIVAIIFVILAIGAFLGFKKFAKWLNRNDVR